MKMSLPNGRNGGGNGNGNGEKVRLHKQMAETGSYPGVGKPGKCCSLAEVQGGDRQHPDASKSHITLPDAHRSGPPSIGRGGGKMAATAHSDHGPHHLPR